MKTNGKLTLVAAAALLYLPAIASAHNYNFLEGGVVNQDQGSRDETGFRIAGSLDVAPPIALFGEYADIDEFNQITAGALYHRNLDRGLDLILGASLENVDVGFDDDTGFGLRGGLRWQALPALELNPEVRYLDVFEEDVTSFRLAGLFALNNPLDLQAAVQVGDDDRYELGVRYNFGSRTTGR